MWTYFYMYYYMNKVREFSALKINRQIMCSLKPRELVKIIVQTFAWESRFPKAKSNTLRSQFSTFLFDQKLKKIFLAQLYFKFLKLKRKEGLDSFTAGLLTILHKQSIEKWKSCCWKSAIQKRSNWKSSYRVYNFSYYLWS